MSGLDFLALALPSSNNFNRNGCFQFFFCLLLLGYKGHIQSLYLGAVCSTGCFWRFENFVAVVFPSGFFKWFSRWNAYFTKVLLFFTLVCNHRALNLRMQVLALPALVTMARPTKTSQRLNWLDLPDRIFRLLLVQQCFSFASFFNILAR